MYRLSISRDFIAQHYLIGGEWGDENQLHSHHYRVDVLVQGGDLNEHGYLIDIVDLDRILAEILSNFRDRVLNDLAEFTGLNPSVERFARILWEKLVERLQLRDQSLTVQLWENAGDWAGYTE
jgi:6-pyruvoyltetrahydropterin/6-carboxytetrahydropterin synthase